MLERNHRLRTEKGYTHQPKLLGEYPDKCYAVYSLFSPTGKWEALRNYLSSVPSCTIYSVSGQARLHLTLIQILTFGYDPKILENFRDKYHTVLTTFLPQLVGMRVKFTRLCVLPHGIVALGYPDRDVNKFRRILRFVLASEGLPLQEPYLADIVHTTVARFHSPLTRAEQENVARLHGSLEYPFEAVLSEWCFGETTWRVGEAEEDSRLVRVS
jgi:hypothetical protein